MKSASNIEHTRALLTPNDRVATDINDDSQNVANIEWVAIWLFVVSHQWETVENISASSLSTFLEPAKKLAMHNDRRPYKIESNSYGKWTWKGQKLT